MTASVAIEAARMRAAGHSVKSIMTHFGWTRSNAHNQIWRGRNYAAAQAKSRARRLAGKPSMERQRQNRERQLAIRTRAAELFAGGKTQREVAEICGISVRTVARACQSRCTTAPDRRFAVDVRFSNIAKQPDESAGDPRICGVEPAALSAAFQISK